MKIKIGSYNIAACRQIERNAAIIAADVEENGLDIVGFQEIDRYANRSNNADMEQDIKNNCSLKHTYYVKTLELGTIEPKYGMGKGDYGIMVASRYPIITAESFELPTEGAEPRFLLHAVLDVEGENLSFYTTHLSHNSDRLRKIQFEVIAKVLSKDKNFILTGDFNTQNFDDFAVIKNANIVNNQDNRIETCLEENGNRIAIDNIVYSDEFKLQNCSLYDKEHSDHSLLCAEFDW